MSRVGQLALEPVEKLDSAFVRRLKNHKEEAHLMTPGDIWLSRD